MRTQHAQASILTLAALVALLCTHANTQHIRRDDGEARALPAHPTKILSDFSPIQPTDNVHRTPPPVLTQSPVICPTSTSFSLDLSYQSLTDAQAQVILINYSFDCQAEFEQLRSFSIFLNNNQLTTTKFLTYVTRTMKNLIILKIYLASNSINNAGIAEVQNMFQYNPLLESFYIELQQNQLTDLYPFKFAFASITKLLTLTLYFYSNQITDLAFASTAFYSLRDLRSLYLDLTYNNVTSFAPLAYAFDKSLKLQDLTLAFGGNRITSVDFALTAFQKLTNLQKFDLYLWENQISNVSPFEIAFDKNFALQQWDVRLTANRITQGIDQLIDGIQVDVGDRKAFCPFYFTIRSNQLTATQIQRLQALQTNLQAQYNTATCSGKKFEFYY